MISGLISLSTSNILSLFSGARSVFFPLFSNIMVSYGMFRVNLFFSCNAVTFFISKIFIDLYLKSLMLRYSSAMVYSMWYIRMHDHSAIKMKHEINGMILLAFLWDNRNSIKHNIIAVTEYTIDIHTHPFAFSDIREVKVFILLNCLICFKWYSNCV